MKTIEILPKEQQQKLTIEVIPIENPKDRMLQRLLAEKGLEAKQIMDEYVIFKNKEQIATIHKDHVVYLSGYKNEAAEVHAIIQATNECFVAYEKGMPLSNEEESTALKDYKSLLSFRSHILAAKITPEDTFEFATWRTNEKANDFELGHYFNDFQEAKEDFAIRSGLFDKSKLFSETEMLVIRAGLIKCTTLDPDIGNEQEKEMGAIIEKIDNVVEPEIKEQKQERTQENEDHTMEMEQ